RQRRDVPNHWQGAIFRMEREGDLPFHRHFPNRRMARGFEPSFRHAIGARLGDDLFVVWIEEDFELRAIELALFLHARGRLDAVGVIKDHAEIADAPDAGFRTDRRHAGFETRIAQDALLRFARGPVVIDLLVRAAGNAHAPAAALVLVDQDHAVLF